MSIAPAPQPMQHRFLTWPSTREGQRAGWLSLAVPGLAIVLGTLGAMADDWSRMVRIAVLLVPTVGMLLGSLVAGVLAVRGLGKGDRSLALLWPLFLGVSVVLFVVGEFAVPH